MSGVVRQVDHVILAGAENVLLFTWLTETLGLPVAWPVAQWGAVYEGGVCVGDTNLGCNRDIDASNDHHNVIQKLALEPNGGYEAAFAELDARGIAHSPTLASPPEFDLPEDPLVAPWNEGWVLSRLSAWREGVPPAFLCLYNHDNDQRRARDVARLSDVGGGRLGIKRVREISVESIDFAADLQGWRNLLSPVAEPVRGLFCLGRGADIRLVEGDRDRYAALVFEVESEMRAADALDELGIGHRRDDCLHVEPADALGLDIRLAG